MFFFPSVGNVKNTSIDPKNSTEVQLWSTTLLQSSQWRGTSHICSRHFPSTHLSLSLGQAMTQITRWPTFVVMWDMHVTACKCNVFKCTLQPFKPLSHMLKGISHRHGDKRLIFSVDSAQRKKNIVECKREIKYEKSKKKSGVRISLKWITF